MQETKLMKEQGRKETEADNLLFAGSIKYFHRERK